MTAKPVTPSRRAAWASEWMFLAISAVLFAAAATLGDEIARQPLLDALVKLRFEDEDR